MQIYHMIANIGHVYVIKYNLTFVIYTKTISTILLINILQ